MYMGEISKYSLMLRYRNGLKRLQQIAWSLTSIEKKYPLELVDTGDVEDLITAYIGFIKDVKAVLKELESEHEK